MANVRILGLDEFDKALKKLLDSLGGGIISDVLIAAAEEEFVGEMKARAPTLSGDLEESIEAVPVEHSKTSALAKVRTTVFYGLFPEFGTRYQRAQPFMRPVVDERDDEFAKNVEERLRAIVLKSVG